MYWFGRSSQLKKQQQIRRAGLQIFLFAPKKENPAPSRDCGRIGGLSRLRGHTGAIVKRLLFISRCVAFDRNFDFSIGGKFRYVKIEPQSSPLKYHKTVVGNAFSWF